MLHMCAFLWETTGSLSLGAFDAIGSLCATQSWHRLSSSVLSHVLTRPFVVSDLSLYFHILANGLKNHAVLVRHLHEWVRFVHALSGRSVTVTVEEHHLKNPENTAGPSFRCGRAGFESLR